MGVEFKKSTLEKGVTLIEVYDKKFVSNEVSIRFVSPINKQKTTAKSLVISLLGTSNANCPDRQEFDKMLSGIYDSSISYSFGTLGDYQYLRLSANFISQKFAFNKFAESEEQIGLTVVKALLDCVYNPDVKDGLFNPEYVKAKKLSLIDDINDRSNDKMQFAIKRSREITYEGEPAAFDALGEAEDVEAVDPKKLWEVYLDIINNSQIEIILCGGDDFSGIKELVCSTVRQHLPKNPPQVKYQSKSPVKPSPAEVTEQMDINQTKMVFSFKTDSDDFYAHKLMNAVFGGSVTSKLFVNVREKMGLCYSCSSAITEGKGVMIAVCGTGEPQKAKDEILRQFELMKNGEFSEEDIECAKRLLCSRFRSNYDSLPAITSWFFTQHIRESEFSPEDVAEIFSGIDKQRIINSAKSFKLDSIYILDSLKGGQGQNE